MAKQQRSIVPLILGIIGGVAGIPSALASGACAVFVESVAGGTEASAQSAGNTFLILGIIAAVVGFGFSVLARGKPVLAGVGMILSGILAGVTLLGGNLLAMIPAICFLVGGAVALVSREKAQPDQA